MARRCYLEEAGAGKAYEGVAACAPIPWAALQSFELALKALAEVSKTN
jgi:hypothetical protein